MPQRLVCSHFKHFCGMPGHTLRQRNGEAFNNLEGRAMRKAMMTERVEYGQLPKMLGHSTTSLHHWQ